MAVGAYGARLAGDHARAAHPGGARRLPARRRAQDGARAASASLAAASWPALGGLAGGPALAAPARRLPGHRHARLRRDHPRASSSTSTPSAARAASPASPTSAASSGCTSGVVVTVIVVHNLVALARYGRALLAVREDEIAAEAMGVDTTRAQGAGLRHRPRSSPASRAGCSRHYTMYLHPELVHLHEVDRDHHHGRPRRPGLASRARCVGAVLLTVLPEVLPRLRRDYRMIIYSLLLILLMIFRPQGLFGNASTSARKSRKRRAAQPTGADGVSGPARRSKDVTMRFGGLMAVERRLDLPHRARASCFGLIGPNGAGKTTRLQPDHRRLRARPPGTIALRRASDIAGCKPPRDQRAAASRAPSRTSGSSRA